MELKYLRLQDFRNLASVQIEPISGFNIFTGANGQGKTNLLEAVYLLSAVKSFRTQKNSDLIAWDKPQAIVEGRVDRAGQERSARIEVSPQGKKVHLNGSLVRKLSRFFGSLNAIVFAPDDIQILKEGPSERRRFLDRAIFNCEASYLADVMSYENVLKQRNALLKDPRSNKTLLEIYDEQLASSGAQVVSRRLAYLREYIPIFCRTFSEIFAGEPEASSEALRATMEYESAWFGPKGLDMVSEAPEASELKETLLNALKAARGEDLRRRFTSRGPHRDDLILNLGGRLAKSFASQGQQRGLVLAMKISEVQIFQERRGFRPILLLDDVSSELDRVRNRFLFDFLAQSPGQVFISTTHRDHILIEGESACFHVENGALTPQ